MTLTPDPSQKVDVCLYEHGMNEISVFHEMNLSNSYRSAHFVDKVLILPVMSIKPAKNN